MYTRNQWKRNTCNCIFDIFPTWTCPSNFYFNQTTVRSKIVNRLRRRQYDPVIIERTIGLALGPYTTLYKPFLKHCTLTNKAVGTIWRALSKPVQRQQGPDLCPLWLLVGTPSAIIPELAFSRAEHSRPYSDVAKYIFWYILFINFAVCLLIFMTSPLGVAVGLLST